MVTFAPKGANSMVRKNWDTIKYVDAPKEANHFFLNSKQSSAIEINWKKNFAPC